MDKIAVDETWLRREIDGSEYEIPCPLSKWTIDEMSSLRQKIIESKYFYPYSLPRCVVYEITSLCTTTTSSCYSGYEITSVQQCQSRMEEVD